jgi:seryl-tRNA synthetase
MDEELSRQIADTAARLASATETLERALERLQAQQEVMEQKVERIVAAVDERTAAASGAPELQERAAQLERENQELRAQAQRTARKTLSPLTSAVLTKGGLDEGELRVDASALDKALGSLTREQRVAVKAEMARAGMIE